MEKISLYLWTESICAYRENPIKLLLIIISKYYLYGGQYYKGSYRNRCQYEKLGWIGSGKRLLESSHKRGVESPGSISHGVS